VVDGSPILLLGMGFGLHLHDRVRRKRVWRGEGGPACTEKNTSNEGGKAWGWRLEIVQLKSEKVTVELPHGTRTRTIPMPCNSSTTMAPPLPKLQLSMRCCFAVCKASASNAGGARDRQVRKKEGGAGQGRGE
jgi:hypothetical protein